MPSQYSKEDRYKVMPGYPKKTKFLDPDKLNRYLSGHRIECLLCGKEYKSLGVHILTMHSMDVEEYQDEYGIPWTRKLTCASTKAKYRDIALKNIEDGVFKPSKEQADLARASLKTQRKRQPIRQVYSDANILELNKNCTLEEKKRRALMSKKGSKEYYVKMVNRPQVKNFIENHLGWWKGKKQSEEHIRKRMESRKRGSPLSIIKGVRHDKVG